MISMLYRAELIRARIVLVGSANLAVFVDSQPSYCGNPNVGC